MQRQGGNNIANITVPTAACLAPARTQHGNCVLPGQMHAHLQSPSHHALSKRRVADFVKGQLVISLQSILAAHGYTHTRRSAENLQAKRPAALSQLNWLLHHTCWHVACMQLLPNSRCARAQPPHQAGQSHRLRSPPPRPAAQRTWFSRPSGEQRPSSGCSQSRISTQVKLAAAPCRCSISKMGR